MRLSRIQGEDVPIAVSDLGAGGTSSTRGQLGLPAVEHAAADGGRIYACGRRRPRCTSTRRPGRAGESSATLATWYVDDVEGVIDELRLQWRDVRALRRSNDRRKGDPHELGDGRVAWFKDPDGNTFAVEQ